MSENNLNQRKEIKPSDEDPTVVAQRILNIFRQLHVFSPEKKKAFDDLILSQPIEIRGAFGKLLGGATLQEYVDELEKKSGLSTSSQLEQGAASGKILDSALENSQSYEDYSPELTNSIQKQMAEALTKISENGLSQNSINPEVFEKVVGKFVKTQTELLASITEKQTQQLAKIISLSLQESYTSSTKTLIDAIKLMSAESANIIKESLTTQGGKPIILSNYIDNSKPTQINSKFDAFEQFEREEKAVKNFSLPDSSTEIKDVDYEIKKEDDSDENFLKNNKKKKKKKNKNTEKDYVILAPQPQNSSQNSEGKSFEENRKKEASENFDIEFVSTHPSSSKREIENLISDNKSDYNKDKAGDNSSKSKLKNDFSEKEISKTRDVSNDDDYIYVEEVKKEPIKSKSDTKKIMDLTSFDVPSEFNFDDDFLLDEKSPSSEFVPSNMNEQTKEKSLEVVSSQVAPVVDNPQITNTYIQEDDDYINIGEESLSADGEDWEWVEEAEEVADEGQQEWVWEYEAGDEAEGGEDWVWDYEKIPEDEDSKFESSSVDDEPLALEEKYYEPEGKPEEKIIPYSSKELLEKESLFKFDASEKKETKLVEPIAVIEDVAPVEKTKIEVKADLPEEEVFETFDMTETDEEPEEIEIKKAKTVVDDFDADFVFSMEDEDSEDIYNK